MSTADEQTANVTEAGSSSPEGSSSPPTPPVDPSGDTAQTDAPQDVKSSPDPSDGELSFHDAIFKSAEQTSGSDTPQPEAEETPDGEEAAAPKTKADDPALEGADASTETQEDEDDGELTDEISDAERKSMSKRTARRIEKLLAERKAARVEAEKAKPIVDYMQQHDIPEQDVDVVLGLARQLRHGDFAGFLRSVSPYVDLARQYVGEVLPQDLQDQVDKGFVSQEVARELAQRRANEHIQRQQAARAKEASEQEVRHLRGKTIQSTVAQWEDATRRSDPDYEAKADIVRRTAQAFIAERGAPQTPEQALEYVKEAYAEANKVISRFRPKPKPTQAQPSSVHQSSQAPKPEPQSMFDVVQRAVGE